jgi:hypothetical protein
MTEIYRPHLIGDLVRKATVLLSRSVAAAAVLSRCRDLLAVLQFGPTRRAWAAVSQLELGCGRLCPYRWWVRGWEICRSYQNCASRRDSHGHGSQAAQLGLTQLILVFPSGVFSSTGRCAAMRRGRAPVVACMSSLLPQRVRPGVLVLVPPARLQTAASGPGGPILRGQSATAGGSHSPGIVHVPPGITATRRACHQIRLRPGRCGRCSS